MALGPLLCPGETAVLARSSPPAFVENRGQLAGEVLFTSTRAGSQAFLTQDGLLLAFDARSTGLPSAGEGCCVTARRSGEPGRVVLGLTVEGALSDARVEGLEPLPGRHSFFRGRDAGRWVTGARGFARVCYRQILPGVDLELYWSGAELEYDLVLGPGAALEGIVLRVDGAERLHLEEDGSLAAETRLGQLRQAPPRIRVLKHGVWTPTGGRFRLLDAQRFGFEVEHRAAHEPCRIDPELTWSSFLGGTGEDGAVGVTVDSSGCPIVTGSTDSLDFPETAGIPSPLGDRDVYVTRLTPDGSTVLYSAVFGGSFAVDPITGGMLPGDELGMDLVVDAAGTITLIGLTGSEDFPTTAGCFDPSYNGGVDLNELGDTFLVRLDPSLGGAAQLVYSTYVGGSLIDNGFALALQANGDVTIAGHCHSPEFPTTSGSYQPVINAPGPGDAFVSRFALGGNGASDLLWATFLGGSGFDYGYGLRLDAAGRAIVAGQAGTTGDFPVTSGAFDETHNGSNDGFVAILDPGMAGSAQLRYATFLGGAGSDTLYELDLHPSGDVVVAGYTSSPDLPVKPVPGAFDESFNGGAMDAFAARLVLAGAGSSDLSWCTYLGGSGDDRAQSVRVRPSGQVTLAGFTGSPDFPVTIGSAGATFGGGSSDAFLSRLGTDGDRLPSSAYLGGSGFDQGFGLALDALGNAFVVGATTSADFPTTAGVLAAAYRGGSFDAFVARLCPEPCALAASFSRGQGGSAGAAGIPGLGPLGRPALGNADFALELTGAAPLASGTWIVRSLPGSGGTTAGAGLGRIPPLRLSLTTDGQGRAILPWPVACQARLCGAGLSVQAVVQDATAPNGRARSPICFVLFGS